MGKCFSIVNKKRLPNNYFVTNDMFIFTIPYLLWDEGTKIISF